MLMKTFKFFKPIAILSIIAIVYFIFSCKKDVNNTIVLNGRIYDPNQKAYVSGADVQFLSSKIVSGSYNPTYVVVASAVTDANGSFHLEYVKDKDAAFQVIVSKDKYFDHTYDIAVTALPGGTYTPTYNIYCDAYFKIHVKNTLPNAANDQIGYAYVNSQPACYTCCNSTPQVGLGNSYDSTSKCRTFGAQKMHVQWSVKKNGNTFQYDSSIFCAPFDTTLFELFY